jgi:hypothetical protein
MRKLNEIVSDEKDITFSRFLLEIKSLKERKQNYNSKT